MTLNINVLSAPIRRPMLEIGIRKKKHIYAAYRRLT